MVIVLGVLAAVLGLGAWLGGWFRADPLVPTDGVERIELLDQSESRPDVTTTTESESAATTTALPAVAASTVTVGPDVARLQGNYRAAVKPGGCAGAPGDMEGDQWCFKIGYSTSYVAWRLNSEHDWAIPFALRSPPGDPTPNWGNAGNWERTAIQIGIEPHAEPAIGNVAWWSTANAPPYGHVGIVEHVGLSEAGSIRSVAVSTLVDDEVVILSEMCTSLGGSLRCGSVGSLLAIADYFDTIVEE